MLANSRGFVVGVAWLACGLGCQPSPARSPSTMARAFADAAASGDGEALYGLLNRRSKQAKTKDEWLKTFADERDELNELGKVATSKDTDARLSVTLELRGKEHATLVFEDGRYRVQSAALIPGGAHTPEIALEQLRRALSLDRRGGLLRILTANARSGAQRDMGAIRAGLAHPEELPIVVRSDVATVDLPRGHHVKLRRESGQWRIESFD